MKTNQKILLDVLFKRFKEAKEQHRKFPTRENLRKFLEAHRQLSLELPCNKLR